MEVSGLVRKTKKGDKEALLQLIMSHKGDYYKLAFTYTGNKEDSMDALEDMIVKVYENIHKLKDDTAFESWSKTILVNCCKAIWRKNRRTVRLDHWKENGITEQYESKEQRVDLQKLLSRLNPHQEEAIRLRYFRDLDIRSISQLTRVPEGTVKSRISKGLKKLRTFYDGGERNE